MRVQENELRIGVGAGPFSHKPDILSDEFEQTVKESISRKRSTLRNSGLPAMELSGLKELEERQEKKVMLNACSACVHHIEAHEDWERNTASYKRASTETTNFDILYRETEKQFYKQAAEGFEREKHKLAKTTEIDKKRVIDTNKQLEPYGLDAEHDF